MLLIAFGVVLYWVLTNPSQAWRFVSGFFSLFFPFLLGGCLAFLVNVVLRPVERGWRRLWGKRYGPRQDKARRPVCLLVSVLLVIGVVFALFFVIVPSLKDSIVNFVNLLPERILQLQNWWNQLSSFLAEHGAHLPDFSLNGQEMQQKILDWMRQYGDQFLNTTISTAIGITSSVVSLIFNLVLALAFALYLLAQKETLTRQAKKVVQAIFSSKRAQQITELAHMTNRAFSNFVTGQLTEALILPVFPGHADFPPSLRRGDLGDHRLYRPHPDLWRLYRGGHWRLADLVGEPHPGTVVHPFHHRPAAD